MYRFPQLLAHSFDNPHLNKSDSIVLKAIGNHADDTGCCILSQNNIADYLNLSRMSVSRSIKKLCALGYITSKQRKRKDGSITSNAYQILFTAHKGGAL